MTYIVAVTKGKRKKYTVVVVKVSPSEEPIIVYNIRSVGCINKVSFFWIFSYNVPSVVPNGFFFVICKSYKETYYEDV